MEIGKAQGGVGLQTLTGLENQEQAKQNAMTSLQAKYGEKPKEARPIKKQLDKDDFMKIMLTEMKHQDPTKPMDAEKMSTQMAQLTTVEQMKNVSAAVEKLADKNSATDRLAMSSMIGKTVTVDKGRFTHLKGTLAPINFDLPEPAQKVKLVILDERGEEVASRELEPKPAGPNIYNWDGLAQNGTPMKTGSYTVRIDAENEKQAKIKIDPISRESIVGVSFEGGETNFLVGDPKTPQKVGFKNVIKIEGDVSMRAAAMNPLPPRDGVVPSATSGVVPAATQTAIKPNEAFKPDFLKANAQVGVDVAKNEKIVEQPEVAEKAEGFANGLRD